MSLQPPSERAQRVLKELIERYISDGQPVGSKTLAAGSSLSLSSATIRSVMSDLEERGFLISPHTSAGRIPTELGYRFFVDTLLQVNPIDERMLASTQQALAIAESREKMITQATNLLSSITKLAGLVTMPKTEQLLLRHIEFLPLSDNRVLVVLVLNDNEVQNRIIYTEKPLPPEQLQAAANFLLEAYRDKDLNTIRQQILHSMRDDRCRIDGLMQSALEMADSVLAGIAVTDDVVLAGQDQLLDHESIATLDQLRDLYRIFSEKQHIVHLLDKCLDSSDVKIFIGHESGYDALEKCSLVGKSYSVNGEVVGVLGVIGPVRMPYEQVISVVDATAKLLSAALENSKSRSAG